MNDNVTDNTSATDGSKRILLVCRHAPYGTSLARESIETALAAGALGVDITLLFINDGVWQLYNHQQVSVIAAKNHGAMLSALPLYGVERLLVDEKSLSERGIKASNLTDIAEVIDKDQVKHLLANCKVILSF